MRIASIILASVPFVVSMGFLVALGNASGPEGYGVFIALLYACIGLAIISAVAVVLAFIKRPPSGLDIPARVISIISLVAFLPAGGFGLLLFVMMLFPPAVNA
jgi:drug/metabolite transporter (DMT)-like permease